MGSLPRCIVAATAILLLGAAWHFTTQIASGDRAGPPSLLCGAVAGCRSLEEAFSYPNATSHDYNSFAEWHAQRAFLSREDLQVIALCMYSHFHEKRRLGQRPRVVHIGPAELSDEDVLLYRRLRDVLARSSFVFVEPNTRVAPILARRLAESGFDMESVEVRSAAVCLTPGISAMPMYRLSAGFLRDNPSVAPQMHVSEHTVSLDRDAFLANTRIHAEHAGASVAEEDVEAFSVPCIAPASLLEAGPIDMLIVDVEGLDVQVLAAFLDAPGVLAAPPAFVMFEWAHPVLWRPGALAALQELVIRLADSGYEVHRHGWDVVAYRPVPDLEHKDWYRPMRERLRL